MNSYSKNNPASVQLVAGPSALAGHVYIIQLDEYGSTTHQQVIPVNFDINDLAGSQNQQYLIPMLQSNQTAEAALTPSAKKEPITISKEKINPSSQQDISHHIQIVSDIKFDLDPLETKLGTKRKRKQLLQNNKGFISMKTKNTIKKHKEKQEEQTVPKQELLSNYTHIADRIVPPRAVAVLPPCLRLHKDRIYPRSRLDARARFGPVQGLLDQRGITRKINQSEANQLVLTAFARKTPIFLMQRNPDSVIHIDISDKDKSNWLGLLPLGDENTANVWLYEEKGELYGITTKPLTPQTHLAFGYSSQYVEEHKIPNGVPLLELHDDPSEPTLKFCCPDCNLELGSDEDLQWHFYTHKTPANSTKRCRCLHCKRVFATKFSMRRHITRGHCVMSGKANENPPSETTDLKPTGPQPPNLTGFSSEPIGIEENRLPSDESLQNYTNNLDISINLFDTDRMPNLDTSGSDFNPFSLGYTYDNGVAAVNDMGYAKFSRELMDKCNSDQICKNKPKTEEKVSVICPYCKLSVLKSKNRLHYKNCLARRCMCECGRTFYRKECLAAHIRLKHPDRLTPKTSKQKTNKTILNEEKNENHTSETPYKCDDCQVYFKRRGMLVNHLWRRHGRHAALPLERPVRHFPCPACGKLYRTGAKRKRHILIHHPGTELPRGGTIVGERVACQAAACPACPRQYLTLAKLYQHQRDHHPDLAVPKKLKGSSKGYLNDKL